MSFLIEVIVALGLEKATCVLLLSKRLRNFTLKCVLSDKRLHNKTVSSHLKNTRILQKNLTCRAGAVRSAVHVRDLRVDGKRRFCPVEQPSSCRQRLHQGPLATTRLGGTGGRTVRSAG